MTRSWDCRCIIRCETVDGIDERDVLLAGHSKNAYWLASQPSCAEPNRLDPHSNATSLRACVAVLSGLVGAIANPRERIVEPDERGFRRNLETCMPCLGSVVGRYTDSNPLPDRGRLFAEGTDASDPWQFRNVRVTEEPAACPVQRRVEDS